MRVHGWIAVVSLLLAAFFLAGSRTPAISQQTTGLGVPYEYIFADALAGAKANPIKQEYINAYTTHLFEYGVDPAKLATVEARYFVNDALVTTTIAVEALESGATELAWNEPGFPAPPPIHPDNWYDTRLIDPESPEFTALLCEKITQWWPSYLIKPQAYWDNCGP